MTESTPQSPAPKIHAVLDTNVFVDIHSCHDFVGTYDESYRALSASAIDEPSVVFRRARARESLLLAIYLNKIKATTVSLQNEAIDILTKCAAPAAGGLSLESDYTTFFVWFVKDYLLANWNPQLFTPELGWEKRLGPGLMSPELLIPGHPELERPTGNNADACQIAYAKEAGLPLITNEGFNPTGYESGKITKRAASEGVHGLFPKDFYAGEINEAEEISLFLQTFREQAPRYLEARSRDIGPDKGYKLLEFMSGFYRHVLLGETEGRTDRVRVSVV